MMRGTRMAGLDQELLNLADKLRLSRTLAERREIRGNIEALAPRVRALDPEQPEQNAVQRLYRYLDARSAAAVRDGAAALRTEHAEIERRLLTVIDQFRSSDGATLAIPSTEFYQLREQISELEPGSNEQWILGRLCEYAAWQRKVASHRQYKRITRNLRTFRTSDTSRGIGVSPTPYRAPSPPKRTRGIER
ncbi:hypothetical protein ACWDO0_27885 [Nocardia rhamnosiphila]